MAKKTNNKKVLMRGLAILGGLAAGSYVKDFVAQKDATSGTDLLGSTSALTSPLLVGAAGVAVMQFAKDQMLKDVGMGITLSGGAGLLNAVTGKSIVSLGSAEEQPVVPLLPGIGDVEERVLYDDLPSENQLVTNYNEITEAGDVDISENYGVGDVDVLL